jgi:hypothetical protein
MRYRIDCNQAGHFRVLRRPWWRPWWWTLRRDAYHAICRDEVIFPFEHLLSWRQEFASLTDAQQAIAQDRRRRAYRRNRRRWVRGVCPCVQEETTYAKIMKRVNGANNMPHTCADCQPKETA